MPRKHERMHTSEQYESTLRSCTNCADMLAKRPVDPANSKDMVIPKPIVRALRPRPIMLLGQAPGLTEYRSGKPFSGQAGLDVRALFAECGCGPDVFERLVHPSAAVKCFPGSKLTPKKRTGGFRREDIKPSSTMLGNCRPFLQAQLDIVAPKLLVLLGGVAIQAYVELRYARKGRAPLEDYVGRVEDWNGRRVVPLAHTSGGSFWLNPPENRARQAEAKRCLAEELKKVMQ